MKAADDRVSVVIPTRNNLAELRLCIASLQSQDHLPTVVLVCVDGSTDATLDWLAEEASTSTVPLIALTHPGNAHRGRAATRNLALSVIRDGHVWYVDSDMRLAVDALRRHLTLVTAQAAVSVGAVNYANAASEEWAGYLNTRGRHRWPDGAELPFTQFTTANSLVRAAEVLELRGFDESFDGYGGEDLEFAFRLQSVAGRSFINNRRAAATTVESKTLDQALRQFQSYGATNIRLMEGLHPEMPRTFELDRLGSKRVRDRLFVASLNPLTDRVADVAIRVAPTRVRHAATSYRVIRAVWQGYQGSSD